jgi:hypothetical protein
MFGRVSYPQIPLESKILGVTRRLHQQPGDPGAVECPEGVIGVMAIFRQLAEAEAAADATAEQIRNDTAEELSHQFLSHAFAVNTAFRH